MSALDELLQVTSEHLVEGTKNARAELDELRAHIAAADARALSAEKLWHLTEAERDELERQLKAARKVISAYRKLPTGPKGYTSAPLIDLHNAADEWLAANHAPEAEHTP